MLRVNDTDITRPRRAAHRNERPPPHRGQRVPSKVWREYAQRRRRKFATAHPQKADGERYFAACNSQTDAYGTVPTVVAAKVMTTTLADAVRRRWYSVGGAPELLFDLLDGQQKSVQPYSWNHAGGDSRDYEQDQLFRSRRPR